MTFLELCQKVAQESGTVSGESQPATVTSQTGRLARIVGWVQDSWRTIQNARNAWLWMEDEFSFAATSGTSEYSGSGVGLTRWAAWATDAESVRSNFTLYATAEGVADEGHLRFMEWRDFRLVYGVGTQTNARPSVFTVDPSGQIVLGPTPDAAYTVRGLYRKGPQELAANSDVPEAPIRHHDVIWRTALLYLAAYDENQTQPPLWQIFRVDGMDALQRDQLPRMGSAGVWA